MSSTTLQIWVGTLNLNGRREGLSEDLSPWLFPSAQVEDMQPDIYVIAFQEIVELSPQQIMYTDSASREAWEEAVKRTLNNRMRNQNDSEYVLLRSGQLVGTSLSIFVKSDQLRYIKNVEGSFKKV